MALLHGNKADKRTQFLDKCCSKASAVRPLILGLSPRSMCFTSNITSYVSQICIPSVLFSLFIIIILKKRKSYSNIRYTVKVYHCFIRVSFIYGKATSRFPNPILNGRSIGNRYTFNQQVAHNFTNQTFQN